MIIKVAEILYYVVLFFTCIIAFIRFKKVDKATRYLCIYIIYGFVNELLVWMCIKDFTESYLYGNIYDYFSLFVQYAFFFNCRKYFKESKLFYVLLGLGITIALTMLIVVTPNNMHHHYSVECITAFLIINVSLYIVYRMVLYDSSGTVYKRPLYWICVLIAMYQVTNIFIKTLFAPQINSQAEIFEKAYAIILYSNTIYYLCLFYIIYRYTTLAKQI